MLQREATAEENQLTVIGNTLVHVLGLLRQGEHREAHQAGTGNGFCGNGIARFNQHDTAATILHGRVDNEAQTVAFDFAGLGQIAEVPLAV